MSADRTELDVDRQFERSNYLVMLLARALTLAANGTSKQKFKTSIAGQVRRKLITPKDAAALADLAWPHYRKPGFHRAVADLATKFHPDNA